MALRYHLKATDPTGRVPTQAGTDCIWHIDRVAADSKNACLKLSLKFLFNINFPFNIIKNFLLSPNTISLKLEHTLRLSGNSVLPA